MKSGIATATFDRSSEMRASSNQIELRLKCDIGQILQRHIAPMLMFGFGLLSFDWRTGDQLP
jgi:hypothetical protein